MHCGYVISNIYSRIFVAFPNKAAWMINGYSRKCDMAIKVTFHLNSCNLLNEEL